MSSYVKDIGTRGVITEKQLGQATPADTNNVSIYSPPTAILSTEITMIVITNTNSATTPKFRIFLDDNGTTYSTATALWYDIELAFNQTLIRAVSFFMNDSTGNLAVRTDTANDITFTVFGSEVTVPSL